MKAEPILLVMLEMIVIFSSEEPSIFIPNVDYSR
jgi:hypothetical protein